MGFDENIVDFVNWVIEYVWLCNVFWWKFFFIGKFLQFGGIFYDIYGMIICFVCEYVNGIYCKLNLDFSIVCKMQIGGFDGDFGSNEILFGNEKWIVIVDGFGVLVDFNGLDCEEFLCLVKKCVMIVEYDFSKFFKDGYCVFVEDSNVILLNGEVIINGMIFCNIYYFCDIGMVDVFVFCGGCLELIDFILVNCFIKDGKLFIFFIVEGVNLFII